MIILLSLAVSFSVLSVWLFKATSVKNDFDRFNLNGLTMRLVGLSKILLSILLLIGLFSQSLLVASSILMGLFMLIAQYYHFKYRSSLQKKLPSLLLLICCLLIIYLGV